MTLQGIKHLPKRMRDKVLVRGECWEWTGARQPTGHGNWWDGERFIQPYRVTYLMAHGPIPEGHVIHHRCENPPCINPKHLVAVNRKEHAAEHGLSGVALMYSQAETCSEGHLFDGYDGRQRTCSVCRRRRSREWAQKKFRDDPEYREKVNRRRRERRARQKEVVQS